MVRTFLAIDLPEGEKSRLAEAIERWRGHRAAVRWTATSRMHLTLKFLGDVPETALESISGACAQAASAHEAFGLRTTVSGVFPSLKRPRVLWVGLASVENGVLHELQQTVEQALEEIGFPREERPFSPHITVGRVKSGKNIRPLMEDFMTYDTGSRPFTVDSFALYSSTLTPRGPIYKELERFALRVPQS